VLIFSSIKNIKKHYYPRSISLFVKIDLKASCPAATLDPKVIFIIQIIIFLILIIILNLSDPSSYSFLSLEIKFMIFL